EGFGPLATGALDGELLLELGDLLVARVDLLGLATALPGLERCELALFAILPPVCQVRRVQAFSAEQGAELTGLGAGVCLLEDRELVLSRESPPLGFCLHLHFGPALVWFWF